MNNAHSPLLRVRCVLCTVLSLLSFKFKNMATIAMIPADKVGNKLFIKDLRVDEKQRTFVKYKSTYNDMPFMEVELYGVDNGQNCAICGDDGTVLYRFSTQWLSTLN